MRNFKVIIKGIFDPDDNFLRHIALEWGKHPIRCTADGLHDKGSVGYDMEMGMKIPYLKWFSESVSFADSICVSL